MACASDPSLPLDDDDSGKRPVDSGGFTVDTGPTESNDPIEFRAQLSMEHLGANFGCLLSLVGLPLVESLGVHSIWSVGAMGEQGDLELGLVDN